MLQPLPNGDGYIVDVRLFHEAVRKSLDDYLRQLVRPEHEELRDSLWAKMNQICSVRTARGALYAADAPT